MQFFKHKDGDHDLTKIYKNFEKHMGEIVMIRLYSSEGLIVIDADKALKNNNYKDKPIKNNFIGADFDEAVQLEKLQMILKGA